MIVGEFPESVDLLVVGGGPGGYTAAIRGAQAGRSVTLVDRGDWDGLGGTCLQVGCIPSKALIELSNAAQATNSPPPGLSRTSATVDLAAWQEHKREVVAGLAHGVSGLMKGNGVNVLEGELRFVAPDRAAVAGAQAATFLHFKDVIIATGSSPMAIPALPVDGTRVVDSAGALALERVPETVCIVGAGYIGLELGMALAKLGAEVRLVEALDKVLPTMGAPAGKAVSASLERLGIELLLGARCEGIDGDSAVVAMSDGEQKRLPAELVVVAAGRTPNTGELGLDMLGLKTDERGFLVTDASLLIGPHVAAIGDVTLGPALAHKATAEAAVAVDTLGGARSTFEPLAVPVVIFTDPEVAACGHTIATANAAGLEARATEFPFSALGRSVAMGNRQGGVQIVVDHQDTVIGATIIGPHASELIAEATLAVEMCATLEDLSQTIHAHPTLSEGVHEAAELALGHPLHIIAKRAQVSLPPAGAS
jgi:dihydrolipoamide dehydrogenase